MADPMNALPGPCGASLGSEGAPSAPQAGVSGLKVRNTHLGLEITFSEKLRANHEFLGNCEQIAFGTRNFLVTNLEHVRPGLLAPI